MNMILSQLTKELREEFPKIYKAQGNFVDSGDLWDKCIATISNIELLKNIKFANDVLKVPPVKVFLLVHDDDFSNLTDNDRKCLGAFWGYVFKFGLKYKNQKSTSISTKGIKSATYFFDGQNEIEIINE